MAAKLADQGETCRWRPSPAAVKWRAMFSNDDDAETSEERYRQRIPLFEADGRPRPRLRHRAHWLLHNCIVHPILAVLPNERATELHTLSSVWLNRTWTRRPRKFAQVTLPLAAPRIAGSSRAWWIFHNLFVHPAIGVAPISAMFRLHDWTADKMDVPGWV
jgi:hypothetical protein